MKTGRTVLIVIAILVVLFFILGPFFVVKEGELGIRTRFGKILQTYSDAGLKFKMPVVDKISKYPKKILPWDGDPQRLPTVENQFIWVDTSARWRISDPKLFFMSIGLIAEAHRRLDQVIESSVRNVIANNSLREAVRNSNVINEIERKNVFLTDSGGSGEDGVEPESIISSTYIDQQYQDIETGREKLSQEMLAMARETTPEYGIELIDIIIRQIKYSDDLTQSVYNRMISERKQIAQAFRSDGQGKKAQWLGRMEKESKVILSGAQRQAKEIRAKADAESLKIRNEAYKVNPEFAEFWIAIQHYEQLLPGARKILTTSMEFFKYLYDKRGQ